MPVLSPSRTIGYASALALSAVTTQVAAIRRDVFVDNDGDGRMDARNHDGRVDYRDAQVIVEASERVAR